MKKGLFSKLVATFTAIIVVSFVMTSAFLSYWFESYYFNQRKYELLRESELIKERALQYLNGNITGGTKNSSYFLSIGNMTQDAMMKDFNYKRTNLLVIWQNLGKIKL